MPAADGLEVNRAVKPYRDGEGQVWFTAVDKILRWDAASAILVDARIGEAGWSIHRDPQGVWWFGNDGLQRRTRGSTVTYKKVDGLAGDSVYVVAPAGKGALWVATDGGLSRFEEEGLQVLSTKDGLPRNVVTRVAVAPDGSVWFTCPQSDSRAAAPQTPSAATMGVQSPVMAASKDWALSPSVACTGCDGTVWGGSRRNNGRGWFTSSITGSARKETGSPSSMLRRG